MKTSREQILQRVRNGHDFPAMSRTILLINKLDAGKEPSVAELSNIILNDHALIAKILKLVNSVNYIEFGEVTTISRAIILLGFENIRNLAMTLLLFDHFKDSGAPDVADTIAKSVFSGMLARSIAADTSAADGEEAFICALFHTFGKMLAGFYLPDEYTAMLNYRRRHNCSEAVATIETLGLTFEDIGTTIAKEWNFPSRIIQSMKRFRGSDFGDASADVDRLCALANFANELTNTIATAGKEIDQKVDELIASFSRHIGNFPDKMRDILASSLRDFSDYSHVFNINADTLPFSRQLAAWSAGEHSNPQPPGPFDIESESLKTIEALTSEPDVMSPELVFTSGIQEMNNSLLQNHPLNDIIRIALETMYRGLSFFGRTKALFFLKDARQPVMTVRFGFGADIEATTTWFRIPLNTAKDIFQVALCKPADLVIRDLDTPELATVVPSWYRSHIDKAIYVILLPIIVNMKPIGLFYAEGEKKHLGKISGGQLKYLTILRDAAVVALKQRQG